jgi:CHASE1-domain containing sensor protein
MSDQPSSRFLSTADWVFITGWLIATAAIVESVFRDHSTGPAVAVAAGMALLGTVLFGLATAIAAQRERRQSSRKGADDA